MIDMATLFAWFVIALLVCAFVAIIVALGSLPKSIAKKRNHPQVEAINALSWIGLALFGIGWPLAFVWAFVKSGSLGAKDTSGEQGNLSLIESELKELKIQVAELNQKLKSIESEK